MPWRTSNFYDYSPSVDEIALRKSITRYSDTFKSILANSRDNFFDATKDRADNIPDAENSNVSAESDKSDSGSTSSSNSTGQGQTEERVTKDRAENIPDAENSNVTAESDKSVSGSTSVSNSTGQGQTEERVPTASSSNSTGQGQNEERVPTVVAGDRSRRQTLRPMLSAYCNSFTFLQRFYNRKYKMSDTFTKQLLSRVDKNHQKDRNLEVHPGCIVIER